MIKQIIGKWVTPIFKINFARFCSSSSNPLTPTDQLFYRHIGPSGHEEKAMLEALEVSSLQQLIDEAIPANIKDPNCLSDGAIGDPISEHEFVSKIRKVLSKNKLYKSYIGLGFYPTLLPEVIKRNLLQNPGWYTAYTPYQAQISQGRLEALINYQTIVQELTQMQLCNSSLLDESSAGGQAMYMGYNIHEGKRKKIFLDQNVFPQTKAVIQTKAKFLDIEVVMGDHNKFFQLYYPNQFFGVIVQTPDTRGVLHDYTQFFKSIDQKEPRIVKMVASDLLSCSITKPPGKMGADICFGSAQRLGVPMGFGGPSAGFFATHQKNVRKMPGRIIGRSIDSQGKLVYRMALQTREQHIRREKATSNICTAQALLANIAGMYGVYHGRKGLQRIANRIHVAAQIAASLFDKYGFNVLNYSQKHSLFFDTITITDCNAVKLNQTFEKNGINIHMVNPKQISLAFNELTKEQDLVEISRILAQFTLQPEIKITYGDMPDFPENLLRTDKYMSHKVFTSIHSESTIMRYMRNLESKDIGLNKSMIPLGSCTMKLNAASEMIPISLPEAEMHPFVPIPQAQGYLQVIDQMREYLKSVTKMDQISFQPNSGAAGEYAGLLTIVQYLKSIGQTHRNICLIPRSAHGTNPASAVLAGLKVVVVEVKDGRVDMTDFKQKCQKYKDNLACFMITFPSTAGLYEDTILQMTSEIHRCGGQVYMDGANMNAQVGYTSPGFLGADVCHLNLHKTFAIPHGGGGPGMGPIAVRWHLAPYLPTHPFANNPKIEACGTLSASKFGSASILNISYAYISMLGRQGVRNCTSYAILNANYLMKRLSSHYKVMYLTGKQRCAHEFIIDLNPIKKRTGVSEEDIAKRLIDFGFHAPTMSFPIPGTLMIEPTESEDKGQLDRFADAMIQIAKEIEEYPDVVKNAPYTADCLLAAQWPYKFTREQAAYPLPWVLKRGKYWPPVRRVSNPYGDRHLICSCPDVSSFLE